jgi:hypothetical protein
LIEYSDVPTGDININKNINFSIELIKIELKIQLKIILFINMECSTDIIDDASINGDFELLNWWKNSKSSVKYTSKSIDHINDYIGIGKPIKILEWWKNSGLPLKYTESSLNNICFNDDIISLKYWFTSNLLIKYNDKTIKIMINKMNINYDMLDLWYEYGYLDKFKINYLSVFDDYRFDMIINIKIADANIDEVILQENKNKQDRIELHNWLENKNLI